MLNLQNRSSKISITITIDNKIGIPTTEINDTTLKQLENLFTFKNPAYGRAKAIAKSMGKHMTIKMPKEIRGWRLYKQELILPRGRISSVLTYFDTIQQPYHIINNTRRLPHVDFQFNGKLRNTQIPAVQAILSRKFNTLEAPTGGGKTTMGIYSIAHRRQPTCIIVHTNKLVDQWAERIAGSKDHPAFLDVPNDEIGYIREGSVSIGKRITIALVQTLIKHINEVYPFFGHVIVDECHHTPAVTFTKIISKMDCAFMTGLSATHERRDGLTPLIYWYIGPLVYEVPLNKLVKEGEILLPEYIIKNTNFWPSKKIKNPSSQWASLLGELTQNKGRNEQIVEDIILEIIGSGGTCLVLSDRKEHCNILTRMLQTRNIQVAVAHSGIPKREREGAMMALRYGDIKVLVATGNLIGEGFDEKAPTTLFLTCPIAFSSRLIQYLGRICRPGIDKKPTKVYDYCDVNVEVLTKAAAERRRTYKKLLKLSMEPIKE